MHDNVGVLCGYKCDNKDILTLHIISGKSIPKTLNVQNVTMNVYPKTYYRLLCRVVKGTVVDNQIRGSRSWDKLSLEGLF